MQTLTAKTCKVCGIDFEAWSQAQRLNRFCGPVCAARWGAYQRDRKRDAANRKALAKRKEALKTRGDFVKAAQIAFNGFIRQRDEGRGCISCGANPVQRYGGGMDCGHYRSVGAAPHQRFSTFNAASQCKRCNRDLSGNVVEMRKGMIARWGLPIVERVELDDRPRKYTIDDLKRIRRIFNRRARHYKKLRDMRDGH